MMLIVGSKQENSHYSDYMDALIIKSIVWLISLPRFKLHYIGYVFVSIQYRSRAKCLEGESDIFPLVKIQR